MHQVVWAAVYNIPAMHQPSVPLAQGDATRSISVGKLSSAPEPAFPLFLCPSG